jgi:PAS domain S-box-containing protein
MTGLADAITDADDAFLEIVGYTREDLLAGRLDWRAMTPPEHVRLDEAGIRQAAEGGGFTVPYQKEFFRKDGSRVPVLLVCAFVPATPGKWMGYVVDLSTPAAQRASPADATLELRTPVPSDFHDRLIAELVRERARVLSMLDSTDALIWATDPQHHLLGFNSAFASVVKAVTGRACSVGDSLLDDELPEAFGKACLHGYEAALRGERVTMRNELEIRDLRHDYVGAFAPIRAPMLGVLGVSCVAQDATAQLAAESALRASETRFRTLAAASPIGIFRANDEGLCEYVNPRLAEIWGVPAERMLGAGWKADIHPDDLARVEAEIEAAPRELNLEYRLARPPGREQRVRVRAAAVPDERDIGGYVGSVDDVTAHYLEGDRERQRAKMESLGTLAGGVAHDFNNVLAIVLSHADLVLGSGGDLPPAVTDSLREIQTVSLRGRDLVRKILTFSRRAATTHVPVELRQLVTESMRLLRPVVDATVAIELHLPDEDLSVTSDAIELQQVIVNLCTNASHAMRTMRAGRLTVTLARTTMEGGAWAELTVRDNGCGMTEEVRHRIFEPFFTTKPLGEGTGMGMAVVHGIVAAAGGTLTVESALGRGTAVIVRLPMQPETSPRPEPRPARTRVLLVEDLPALRWPLELALGRAGYEVVTAGDGLEAIRLFDSSPPFALLLTDVAMPQMTGHRLAAELRGRRPSLGVILMSGHPPTVDAGFDPGGDPASAFISKPFRLNELVELVGRVVAAASPSPSSE